MQVLRPLYDIHSHILPDIDDGAADLDVTLAMLRTAAERGVTSIVATPHSYAVAERGGIATLNDRLDRAKALLDEHGIPLELLPGMEIHLMPDVPEHLAAGRYIPINGTRYVLVEFDYTQWAPYTDDLLFEIATQRFVPLLAHVERITPLQDHPDRVLALIERGYYTQITAMSLMGGFGPQPQKTAEYLLKHNAVHVVASDMHRPDGNRQPWPREADARLARIVGEEAATVLIYENPARVVRGEPLLTIAAKPARRRWGFLPF
jgi:protein-tyrosine phosphatase